MTEGSRGALSPAPVHATGALPTHRKLAAWALPAAAVLLAALWALDRWVFHLDVLTTYQGARPASPLYAWWKPLVRPELALFAAAAGLLVLLAPRLADPERTGRGPFRLFLFSAATLLPLALFLVRQDPGELGASFAVYRNEEFIDDARKIPLMRDASGASGVAVFLRHYVEAMPRLSLHGQHFPPGHALWLHAVGTLFGPSLLGAGLSVLAAFATGMLLAHAALARLLGEAAARQGAVLLLAAPALLDFACTAMDAVLFLWAMLAWALALRALRERASPLSALLAGLAFAAAACASFAALPLGLVVALHALFLGWRRAHAWSFLARQLALVAGGFAAALALVWLLTGFAWWDCLLHARESGLALMTRILKGPPGARWLAISYGNLAGFALGSGLALACVLLARARAGRSATAAASAWTGAALLTLAVMIGGGLFYMETERIWLFAIPWIAALGLAPGALRAAGLRLALAAGLAQALVLETLFLTLW